MVGGAAFTRTIVRSVTFSCLFAWPAPQSFEGDLTRSARLVHGLDQSFFRRGYPNV
jgi:hypothetical protein